jgi:nucleoside-diphosphate-sugar epimerase
VRILVTGGSGYLGSRVAEGLVGAGHEVRALVRRPDAQLPRGVSAVAGDVTDPESLRAAAADRAAIVHAAALVKLWVADRRVYDAVNVQGTLHVAVVARERAARFVHVS